MKKTNRIIAVLAAAAVMLAACLSAAGCADYSQMLQQYSQSSQPMETLAPGQSIYELSMFNDLPSTYSDIDPAFWVAEGKNGGKVYFLGSIHCADKSSYRLPEKIINAYLESDALAVECDIVTYEHELQSNLLLQFSAAKDMMYMDGTTIKDHVSPEVYTQMINFWNEYGGSFAAQGYNTSMMEKMKPAVWLSLFTNMQIEAANLDGNLGIDSHLLKIAIAQGKQIIEIESVEFQNNMLFGYSDAVNEMLLSSYVATPMPEQGEALYKTYLSWQEGDLDALMSDEEFTEDDFEGATPQEIEEFMQTYNEYNDAMLYNRNSGMVDRAAQMIDNGQNVFYVVGAAHMAGQKGIIAQLRGRGYKIDQIGGKDSDGTHPGAATTADTTAATTTTASADDTLTTAKTTAHDYDPVYESQYDLYEKLYEYFGGTTHAKDETERTTAATTAATNTGNTNTQDGWGGWGSSDGTPLGGRGIID